MATLEQVKKDAAKRFANQDIDGWILRTFGLTGYVRILAVASVVLGIVLVLFFMNLHKLGVI